MLRIDKAILDTNGVIGNKTDWSMRVFTSEKKINYPSYILKAIGIDSENVGDRDE